MQLYKIATPNMVFPNPLNSITSEVSRAHLSNQRPLTSLNVLIAETVNPMSLLLTPAFYRIKCAIRFAAIINDNVPLEIN